MPVKKLSSVSDGTDIHELQACIYPGGHCPLFGVHHTLGNISGITILVIGTADCGFYVYKTMKNFKSKSWHGAGIRCAVLEEADVINGCEEDLKNILTQLDNDVETRLIVIVTTCVLELIGEDIPGIVHGVQKQFNTPISIIRSENFKTADYLQGVEQSMESVSSLIRPIPKVPKRFSILGPRFSGIEKNLVIQRLLQNGYTIVSQFPFDADISSVQEISSSSFVIITENTALKLARSLESKFQIPFVDFTPSPFPADVKASFDRLSELTGVSFNKDMEAEENEIEILRNSLASLYRNKKFIIGNVIGSPFTAACLIAEIGGDIELILARNIYKEDGKSVCRLIEMGQDPLVAKNANISAMEICFPRFEADFHIGMGWGRTMNDNGIRFLSSGALAPWIGTCYRKNFYRSLLKQGEES